MVVSYVQYERVLVVRQCFRKNKNLTTTGFSVRKFNDEMNDGVQNRGSLVCVTPNLTHSTEEANTHSSPVTTSINFIFLPTRFGWLRQSFSFTSKRINDSTVVARARAIIYDIGNLPKPASHDLQQCFVRVNPADSFTSVSQTCTNCTRSY